MTEITGSFYELNNRDSEYIRFCRTWIEAWKRGNTNPESSLRRRAALENFVECVVAYMQIHKGDRLEQHEDVAQALGTIQFDDDSLEVEQITELENEFYYVLVQKLINAQSPQALATEEVDVELMEMRKKIGTSIRVRDIERRKQG